MTTTHDDAAPETGQDEKQKRKPGEGRSLPQYLAPAHINSILSGYPAQTRFVINWLAGYCRDHCQSDHKILAAHTTQAGCSRSFSHFYNLFRGTSDLTGEGSISGLLEVYGKLKTYERMSEARGEMIFGETNLYLDFEALVLSRRKANIRNRLMMISGPTGSGKTELTKEFIRRKGDKLRIAVVDSSQKPSLWDYLPIFCRAVGVTASGHMGMKTELVIANAATYDVIFLDDAHRLYRENGATNQPCWNFIQRLHDGCPSTVFPITLTDVFAQDIRKIRYFDQFFGRAGGRGNLFKMPDFPEDDQILAVSTAYGLQRAGDHLEDLRKAAHGYERLRPLQDALAIARGDAKDGKFDFDDLQAFLPPPMDPEDAVPLKTSKRKGR